MHGTRGPGQAEVIPCRGLAGDRVQPVVVRKTAGPTPGGAHPPSAPGTRPATGIFPQHGGRAPGVRPSRVPAPEGGPAGGMPGPQPGGGPAWPGLPAGEDGSDGSGSPDPGDGVGGGGWSVMNAPQHRLERFTIFPAARPSRSPDRRKERRYPIDADVEYSLIYQGRTIETGRGRTVDASSNGILFESKRALPAGVQIELSIAWPVRLADRVALKLCVSGQTVRGRGNCTAVAIRRHVFRTKGTLELVRSSPR